MFIRFNIKGSIFDILGDLCMYLNYILDIYITKFIIINTNCCLPIITKHHKKIIKLITIITMIRHYVITNKIENLFLNELKYNQSLNGDLILNKLVSPSHERILEYNNYYKIINDFCIELYTINQSFKNNFNNKKKNSQEMIEFHIYASYLTKRIYKNLILINNLITMLINNPKELNITVYKQLFDKLINNKEQTAISCTYKDTTIIQF
jgi:hypothetical protein